MFRFFVMAYAIVCYAGFLAVSLWLVAFLLDIGALRSAKPAGPWLWAGLGNLSLILLFGLVHSIMARPAFKRWWVRHIPEPAERATYVLQSSLLLGAIIHFWQPIPQLVWQVGGLAEMLVLAGFVAGLGLVVVSTFALDHLEFTGLKQAWQSLGNTPLPAPRFRLPLPYRIVRHPLQLGLLLMFFCVPEMTVGGLLFAGAMLAYMLVGLQFEERALLRTFGADYAAYRQRVPMLVPRPALPWRRVAK